MYRDNPRMTAIFRAAALAFAAAFLFAPAARAEHRLMMFEQQGCAYCIMWHNEIGPIYPTTREGRAAVEHSGLPDRPRHGQGRRCIRARYGQAHSNR